MLLVETDPARLLDRFEAYEPPAIPKWIDPRRVVKRGISVSAGSRRSRGASQRVQPPRRRAADERGAGEAEEEAQDEKPVGERRGRAVAVDVEDGGVAKRWAKTP